MHGPEYVTSATVQAHAVNPAEFQAVIRKAKLGKNAVVRESRS